MNRLGNQFVSVFKPKFVVWVVLGLIGIAVFWGVIDFFQAKFYIRPFDLDQEYEALLQIKSHPRFCNRLFQGRDRPIVEASARHWPDAVKELLAQGADPNARNGYGNLAILAASQDSGPEGEQIVGMLLDAGADPHLRDPVYSDLMGSACNRCNLGVVALLLERGWDPNRPEQGNPGDDTPIYEAFQSPYPGIDGTGRMKTLQLLVGHGANVHQKIRGKSLLELIDEKERSEVLSTRKFIAERRKEILYLRQVALNQPNN